MKRIAASFTLLSFAAGLGCWSALAAPNAQVHLVVAFPSHVDLNGMPPGPKVTTIQATATLTNSSRSDVTLHANGCDATYDILDAKTMKVVEGFPDMCTMQYRTRPLPAGASITGSGPVKLDGVEIKKSGDYILRYTFWGYSTDVKFSATVTAITQPASNMAGPPPSSAAFCGRVIKVDPRACVIVHQSIVNAPTYDITGVGPTQPTIGELIVGKGHITGPSTCNAKYVHLDNVTFQKAAVCPLN